MPPFNMKLPARSERAMRHLEASGDCRVLKRLPHLGEIWCRSSPVPDPAKTITLAVIDTETTGLIASQHKMLEIAIVKMRIDSETGELLDIEPPQSWLEDPCAPLTETIEDITGLSDAALAGQSFDDRAIAAALSDVTCVIAHNAKFDFAFFRPRFPKILLPWACSCDEVRWAEHGLGIAKSVSALLAAARMFADTEHRAGPDAWSVAMLLLLPGYDGRTIAWHLVQRAKRPTYRLTATHAPMSVKDHLKGAGYRWCPIRKAWWLEADTERLDNERAWLTSVCPLIRPVTITIDWFDRHAS
jgi:DNA polymerase III subunit epsilon